MKVIRGAVCAENNEKSISENALLLVSEILAANRLADRDVECVFFSVTPDLNACYPAAAVRRNLLPEASFMCFSEMPAEGSMPHVIRVAVFVNKDILPVHRYIGEASALRPDLN